MDGDGGGDADAHTDGHGGGDILEWKCQRHRREGLGSQSGHVDAVHNVVQGLNQHGDDHRHGHGHQKAEYRAGFHKLIGLVLICLIHLNFSSILSARMTAGEQKSHRHLFEF